MTKTPRSPSYPAISLPEAVVRLQAIYDKEGTSPADREVIAQSMGYSGRSGSSDSVIAALSHFGLLEDAGNRALRISRSGLDIVLGEFGEIERANAVREAAEKPTLFLELARQFGGSRFSDRNVETFLIKNGFNQNAAARAAKAYRDTIEFVEQETRGLRSDSSRSVLQEGSQPTISDTSAGSLASASAEQGTPEQLSSDRSVWILPVDDDKEVRLDFRGPLTSDEIETLIEQLAIIQKRIARREQRSSSDDDQ